MNKQGLMSGGLSSVMHNKRYIFWFWLLNLTLAEFGVAAFRRNAHAVLDHTLYAERLVKGFDAGVFGELLFKPEFGSLKSSTSPALFFGFVFFLATALLLPGVFAGYASTYRLPREDFFRACGRNLWRFIRIMLIAVFVTVIVGGLLFAANGAIADKANESTNEKLPFTLQMIGLGVILLVMSTLRIWFDLAEADTVLSDQRAVRKSIATSFKHTFRSLPRLLTSYVVSTIVAAIIVVAGIWCWIKFVSPESILGAFLLAQIILFLLLIPRFWQRGIAVSYWKQKMMAPVFAAQSVEATPVPAEEVTPTPEPLPFPATPAVPPGETQ